jgi:release factor glutamine methyltransferase
LKPIGSVLEQIQARLVGLSETPLLDGQVLLAHILGRPRAWLLAHPESEITAQELVALQSGLARLERGEPLPYILGHWEFFGLEFKVTPDILIPRPETELLVETGIDWLKRHPERRSAADIGTGTGCIAIALAAHVPDLQVIATDISPPALQVARENAQVHGVASRIRFVECDLLPPGAERYDLACANLPYIPSQILAGLEVSRNEPSLALDGGPSGLDQIQRLLKAAPKRIKPAGLVLLEIEASQGEIAREAARVTFPKAEVQVLHDLAGRDRLVSIQLPSTG